MARVHLRSIWFNSAADLSDWLYLESASMVQRSDGVEGSTYRTPSRIRFVQQAGPMTRTWRVSCEMATADERAWLRTHIGLPGVWVRDHLGQRIFGVYTSVTDAPEVWADVSPVTIEITGITPESA